MDGRRLSDAVHGRCEGACRDFLRDELPELAAENLARYLSVMIERELSNTSRELLEECEVLEAPGPRECVRVVHRQGGERSIIVMGINLDQERVSQALDVLKASGARDKVLLYLFSFGTAKGEESIAQAIMEGEMLQMVRGTGITVLMAMLDAHAGMAMLARVDGDRRMVEYLTY